MSTTEIYIVGSIVGLIVAQYIAIRLRKALTRELKISVTNLYLVKEYSSVARIEERGAELWNDFIRRSRSLPVGWVFPINLYISRYHRMAKKNYDEMVTRLISEHKFRKSLMSSSPFAEYNKEGQDGCK